MPLAAHGAPRQHHRVVPWDGVGVTGRRSLKLKRGSTAPECGQGAGDGEDRHSTRTVTRRRVSCPKNSQERSPGEDTARRRLGQLARPGLWLPAARRRGLGLVSTGCRAGPHPLDPRPGSRGASGGQEGLVGRGETTPGHGPSMWVQPRGPGQAHSKAQACPGWALAVGPPRSPPPGQRHFLSMGLQREARAFTNTKCQKSPQSTGDCLPRKREKRQRGSRKSQTHHTRASASRRAQAGVAQPVGAEGPRGVHT